MSKKVQCLLCPFKCILDEGERGVCYVRVNIGGKLISLVYGKPAAVHVDPIEKKPIYHMYPGSGAFSIELLDVILDVNSVKTGNYLRVNLKKI